MTTPEQYKKDHPADFADKAEAGVGGTGGLPGSNAAPAAAELPEDELKDTVDGNG